MKWLGWFRRFRFLKRLVMLENVVRRLLMQTQSLAPCTECWGMFVGAEMFYTANSVTKAVRVVCPGCVRRVNRATEQVMGQVAALQEQRAQGARPPQVEPGKGANGQGDQVTAEEPGGIDEDGTSARLKVIREGASDDLQSR